MLRMILHDWADEYSIKILRHLRDAASPTTQLVIIDSIVSHACPEPSDPAEVHHAVKPVFPEPLLPNGGVSSITQYYSDMVVRVDLTSLKCN